MKTKIKEWGGCSIVVLSPEFMKFHELKVGDWLDLADVHKARRQPNEN